MTDGSICLDSKISIHALLAESDVTREPATNGNNKFLSTLSLRRATGGRHVIKTRAKNFYPRSPCGERHCTSIGRPKRLYFYPRSPCGERRHFGVLRPSRVGFLSTLSLRRATGLSCNGRRYYFDFYPRSPCGERPAQKCYHGSPAADFYPRSPCGERPPGPNSMTPERYYFYPRSPCGERLITVGAGTMISPFLSTLSLRRATRWKG